MKRPNIIDLRVSGSSYDQTELLTALADEVEELYRAQQNTENSNLLNRLVLRLDVCYDWQCILNNESHLLVEMEKLIRERFSTLSLYVLFSSNFQLYCHEIHGGSVLQHDEEMLNTLREEELTSTALHSGAIYHQYGTIYFRLPSNEVCDFFFRVGNLLSNKDNLERLWFWSIPYLEGVREIVCDTWSISTLSAYMAMNLQSYSDDGLVKWSYLAKYLEDDEEMTQQLKVALDRALLNKEKVFILLSATASGRTQIAINKLINECGLQSELAFVLTGYKLTDKPVDGQVLCDISTALKNIGLTGFKDVARIAPSRRIFDIDPKIYFPTFAEVATFQFRAGVDVDTHTGRYRDFFEEYSGKNIFAVCKDGRTNRTLRTFRHHAFHVDIVKLFSQESFKLKLEAIVRECDTFTHIVFHGLSSDRFLANLVCSQKDLSIVFIEVASFENMEKNEAVVAALQSENSHVLFLDALAITGESRVAPFQISLRAYSENMDISSIAASTNVTYIVGLARPSTEKKFQIWEEQLPQGTGSDNMKLKVCIVEKVILPDWGNGFCPWCAEARLLKSITGPLVDSLSIAEREYLRKRVERISGANGMNADIYFNNRTDEKYVFNGGSFFLRIDKVAGGKDSLSDADLACATAGAFQVWRSDASIGSMSHYYLDAKILFESNWYNETRLKAAILRSVRAHEMYLSDTVATDLAYSFSQHVFRGVDGGRARILNFEVALSMRTYLKRLFLITGVHDNLTSQEKIIDMIASTPQQ